MALLHVLLVVVLGGVEQYQRVGVVLPRHVLVVDGAVAVLKEVGVVAEDAQQGHDAAQDGQAEVRGGRQCLRISDRSKAGSELLT